MSRKVDRPEEMGRRLRDIFNRYSGERGDLIPILQDIQAAEGYVPAQAMTETARFLNVPESTVYGVATFYDQFHLTRRGKHRIKVCRGTACDVCGAADITRAVERKLGISPGQTTEDCLFSLEQVVCFGSCPLGPVIVIDDKVYGRMTPEKTEELLEKLE